MICNICGHKLHINHDIRKCICDNCLDVTAMSSEYLGESVNMLKAAYELRQQMKFDKAQKIYKDLLTQYPDDIELLWGKLLCHYGVLYHYNDEDFSYYPFSYMTTHSLISDNKDYERIMELLPKELKGAYKKKTDSIVLSQNTIINNSRKKKKYDIIICYIDKDEDGDRTKEADVAEKIYDDFIKKSYKVYMYSGFSGKDERRERDAEVYKALNTASVMILLGSSRENFDNISISTDWKRFIRIMMKKKEAVLVPCYMDMKADELPPLLRRFKAQNASREGFERSIVKGTERFIKNSCGTNKKISVIAAQNGKKYLIITAMLILSIYTVIGVIYYSSRYKKAVSYLEKLNYIEAIELLTDISGYKDSKDLLEKCYYDMYNNAKIGDTVSFGNYNGYTKWRILDRVNNKILMITEDVIELRAYNSVSKDITWEDSEIRKWLNNTYYNLTFSDDEKKLIKNSTLKNQDNSEYGIDGGNETKDKVFLLAQTAANKYFSSNEERIAYNNGKACSWLLRTPGYTGKYVSNVAFTGEVSVVGQSISNKSGIRPTVWIDISSLTDE